jgi:hypothetical protein
MSQTMIACSMHGNAERCGFPRVQRRSSGSLNLNTCTTADHFTACT